MSELIRKNIRMSVKTASWYETKAKEMGVSQSNLMAMALADYMRNDKAVDTMADLKTWLAELEKQKKTTK